MNPFTGIPKWVIAVAILLLCAAAAVWIPAYQECRIRGGFLVKDALGMPACITQPTGILVPMR